MLMIVTTEKPCNQLIPCLAIKKPDMAVESIETRHIYPIYGVYGVRFVKNRIVHDVIPKIADAIWIYMIIGLFSIYGDNS